MEFPPGAALRRAEGISLGGKAFPSYVAITADGQMLVGEPARRQAVVNPEGTVTAFKRGWASARRSASGAAWRRPDGARPQDACSPVPPHAAQSRGRSSAVR